MRIRDSLRKETRRNLDPEVPHQVVVRSDGEAHESFLPKKQEVIDVRRSDDDVAMMRDDGDDHVLKICLYPFYVSLCPFSSGLPPPFPHTHTHSPSMLEANIVYKRSSRGEITIFQQLSLSTHGALSTFGIGSHLIITALLWNVSDVSVMVSH